MSLLLKIQNQIALTWSSAMSILKMGLLAGRTAPYPTANAKELVILGNGPSLRKLLDNETDFLKEKDLLVVNFSAVSQDYASLRPANYLLMDPAFFDDESIRERVFEPMVAKTNWEMNLFVPVSAFKHPEWQQLVAANRHIHLHRFNANPVEGLTAISHAIYRKGLGMPRPRNVLVACLMVALRLPYNTIYLGGADHSWLQELWVDDQNVVNEDCAHFYKKDTTRVVSPHRLHVLLESMSIAFRSYHEVESYAKSIGKKIYNITKGSYIDAFDRLNIDGKMVQKEEKLP